MEGYDEWVIHHYDASEVLIINMDTTDVVNSSIDAERVCRMVDEKLNEILNVTKAHIG